MAIKPSKVSPCSSKSLATQDTPVRILTSSNDIYFPDTSSLFHEGTVSSSFQPSAFPSSSVQMEGKARKCLFSTLQTSLQSIFQRNFFKCRFTTFQFNFGFMWQIGGTSFPGSKKPHCTHRIPQIFHWYSCGADGHSVGVRSCDYHIIFRPITLVPLIWAAPDKK